jgi:hypothetical protein
MKELLKAINEMERACLAKECGLSKISELKENGEKETRNYYVWLCRQTPAWIHKDFESFGAKF